MADRPVGPDSGDPGPGRRSPYEPNGGIRLDRGPGGTPSDLTERDSGMSIDLMVSIGYRRRRPDTRDRWESRLDSIGLMLIGGVIAIALILIVVPRLLAWLGSLG